MRPASRARRREVQTRKVPDRRNLGLSTTTPTHTTAAGTMAASLARLPVAESRLRRALSGRLRRLSRGPLRGGSGRVQRRAVGLRGLVYFVGTHTRSTVPRGRSAAALGDDATVAQILHALSTEYICTGGGRRGAGSLDIALHRCPCRPLGQVRPSFRAANG